MLENRSSTILLIEDQAADVDLIQHTLLKVDPGLIIEIARDGEEAVNFLERWDNGHSLPAAIFLDINIPRVNGQEVLIKIKKHPQYRIIPVIILTSSEKDEDILQAYAAGANSYILKSTNYDEFSKTIRLARRYWCELNILPE